MKRRLTTHLVCLNADTVCLSNSVTGLRSTNCIAEEKITEKFHVLRCANTQLLCALP